MRHRGYMPQRDRRSPGRRQKTCIRRRCTELVSYLHHTLPNWLPQTFCLEREHTLQKSCLVKAHLFSATFGGFLRNSKCQGSWLIFLSPLLTDSCVLSLALQDVMAKTILLAWGLQHV